MTCSPPRKGRNDTPSPQSGCSPAHSLLEVQLSKHLAERCVCKLITASGKTGASPGPGPRVPAVPKLLKQKKPVHLRGPDGSQGEIYFSPQIALNVALSQSLDAMVTRPSNTSLDRTDRGKPETFANSICPPGRFTGLATKPIKTISRSVGVSSRTEEL